MAHGPWHTDFGGASSELGWGELGDRVEVDREGAAAAGLELTCAGPGPVLGLRAQAALDGVVVNVCDGLVNGFWREQVSVVAAAALPEAVDHFSVGRRVGELVKLV